MKTAVLLFGLVVAMLAAISSAQPNQHAQAVAPFWSDLQAGNYSVGFRVLYTRDHRRNWLKVPNGVADPGRPIRISLWYPAVPASPAQPMKYGDYLHHDGPADFREFNQALDQSDMESWKSDVSDLPQPNATLARVLSMPVAAFSTVPAAPGRFPLLLFSGGKASRADANVELGEYLASHGYIVATVPQLGPSDKKIELGSSPQEISFHADDYDAALPLLRKLPEVDFHHIAAAGHSAGGEVAVELALRHPEVSGVIGLDASYGTTGGARVLVQLPEYTPGRKVAAILLDLRRGEGSQGVKLDLTKIDALRWPEVYRLVFANGFHGDFTEWGSIGFELSVPMPPNPDGHTRAIGYEVNRHVCHAVLDFLNARLRNDQDAMRSLGAEVRDVPTIKFTHFQGSPQAKRSEKD